jgi:hypothetical protein
VNAVSDTLEAYALIVCCCWIREYKMGTYHCTIDLLFDWFGIICMTTENFSFSFAKQLIQIGQTGGQWFSDTSCFGIPWLDLPATLYGQVLMLLTFIESHTPKTEPVHSYPNGFYRPQHCNHCLCKCIFTWLKEG